MTDISPQEYEKVLQWASSVQDKYPGMLVRPKCAPHFKRVLHAENENHPLLSTYISACRAGTQYCRIDPRGVVTPCPYMDVPAGSLKTSEFGEIWNNSPVFEKYRTPVYEGKCGLCRYRLLCGGCRARAYANQQGEMGEDSYCAYEPQGQEEALENIDTISKYGGGTEITLKWAPDAEATIAKIPFFARAIVRLAVERHARARKIETITMETIKACAPSGRFKRPSSSQ
jgi:radical SAM protein with 4Fe4S-binding SPASM domain